MTDDRQDSRASPSACGWSPQGKRGADARGLGRSRGGLSTKIHAATDALGLPVRLIGSPGQRSDIVKAPETHRFKVYTAGQKRGMTAAIKCQMKRRAAVEPVIGHLKDDHRMDRNHLAGRSCDAANVVLAIGYNFRRLLAWLRLWLSAFWIAFANANQPVHACQAACSAFFTDG